MSERRDVCPAARHDKPEERVVCVLDPAPAPAGAFTLLCWRCLETMLKRADDREAVRQEWEVEDFDPLP